jgi:hypothetical protein
MYWKIATRILHSLFAIRAVLAAGGPSSPPSPNSGGESASGLAIATLACGIGAWTILPGIAAFFGIILGWIELKNIKEGKSPEAGKMITQLGFYASLASIVLGVVGACAGTVLVILVYAGVIAGVGGLAIFSELANSLPQ